MKQITKYEAKDGNIFDTELDCIKYENKLSTIEKLGNDLYLRYVDIEDLYEWVVEHLHLFNSNEVDKSE